LTFVKHRNRAALRQERETDGTGLAGVFASAAGCAFHRQARAGDFGTPWPVCDVIFQQSAGRAGCRAVTAEITCAFGEIDLRQSGVVQADDVGRTGPRTGSAAVAQICECRLRPRGVHDRKRGLFELPPQKISPCDTDIHSLHRLAVKNVLLIRLLFKRFD
jgi:hypothetical protein